MAFTGGGMMNLLSAGVRVGIHVNYTGQHLLSAFRRDVNAANADVIRMSNTLARAQIIRWAIPAVGIGAMIGMLGKAVHAGEELQQTMVQIGMITGANAEQMDKYLQILSVASNRTRFSTAAVGNLALTAVKSMPLIQQQGAAGFMRFAPSVPMMAEVASLFSSLPEGAGKMGESAIATAMGKILTLTGTSAKSSAEMDKMIGLVGATLLRGSFKSPEQLTTGLGYMQGVAAPMDPAQQMAYLQTITSRGITGGSRGGAVGGRSIEQLVEAMFGKISVGGGSRGLPRTLSFFPDAKSGMSAEQRKMQEITHQLGLDQYKAELIKAGKIDIPLLVHAIDEGAKKMSMPEWAKLMNTMPTIFRRVFAEAREKPLGLEVANFTKLINDSVPKIREFNDAMLTTSRVARQQLSANIEDTAAILGLQLLPQLARFYSFLDSGVIMVKNFLYANQTAASALIDLTLIVLGTVAAMTAFRMSESLLAILRFGSMVTAGSALAESGVAVGTFIAGSTFVAAIPYIIAAVVTAIIAGPVLLQAWDWLKSKVTGEETPIEKANKIITPYERAIEEMQGLSAEQKAWMINKHLGEKNLGPFPMSIPGGGNEVPPVADPTAYAFAPFMLHSARNPRFNKGAFERLDLPGGAGIADTLTGAQKADAELNNVANSGNALALVFDNIAAAASSTAPDPKTRWSWDNVASMITGAPAVGEQGNSKILSNIADIFTQGPAAAMPDAGMGGFAFRLGNFAISIVDLITKTIPLPGAGGTGAIVPPPLPTNNQHVITSEKDTPFMPAEPPHASHDHPIKLVFSYGADGTVAGTVKGAEVRHARDTPRNTPASKAHTTRSPMPSGTPNGR